MDWPPDGLEFNTQGFPKYHQINEYLPNAERDKIRVCRCWQSKKFPFCDDTHKQLVEAGDDVGPMVMVYSKQQRSVIPASVAGAMNMLQETGKQAKPLLCVGLFFFSIGIAAGAKMKIKNYSQIMPEGWFVNKDVEDAPTNSSSSDSSNSGGMGVMSSFTTGTNGYWNALMSFVQGSLDNVSDDTSFVNTEDDVLELEIMLSSATGIDSSSAINISPNAESTGSSTSAKDNSRRTSASQQHKGDDENESGSTENDGAATESRFNMTSIFHNRGHGHITPATSSSPSIQRVLASLEDIDSSWLASSLSAAVSPIGTTSPTETSEHCLPNPQDPDQETEESRPPGEETPLRKKS